MKKALLALAVAGASFSAQADVKISGFVSAQVLDLEDSDKVQYTRNGFSQSRFRIDSSTKWNDLTVGTNMEFGLPDSQGSLNTRRNSFYVKGGFGTIRLGDHNDVGDGIMNVGSAGTWTSNALAGTSFTTGVNSAINGFDPHRGQGIRYYSPKIAGVATIAAQLQNEGGSEIALRINSNGFKVSYFTENGGGTNNDLSGYLVGYKAPFGVSLTVVHTEQDLQTSTTAQSSVLNGDGTITTTPASTTQGGTNEHDAVKLGYHSGQHKVSISSHTRDDANRTADVEATGFGYEYAATKGVLLYLSYVKTDGLVQNGIEAAEDRGIAIGGVVKF